MLKWNEAEYRAFLQFKKVIGGDAMPSGKMLKYCRCLEIMGRVSPSCSPHPSDDEGDDVEEVTVLPLMENKL